MVQDDDGQEYVYDSEDDGKMDTVNNWECLSFSKHSHQESESGDNIIQILEAIGVYHCYCFFFMFLIWVYG